MSLCEIFILAPPSLVEGKLIDIENLSGNPLNK